ncbi:ribonuclease E inhibitor RraB [Novosphingobium kaempferiae]|uniref:ribonuclease E inhibitor RraB n=1 Tax=Novosphingobium kaempferiae TaxID=2896849 RepID=UPI001E36CEDF|nr:ribonuclease E inhibitor RraB [Novosphingobium kaempferiae]
MPEKVPLAVQIEALHQQAISEEERKRVTLRFTFLDQLSALNFARDAKGLGCETMVAPHRAESPMYLVTTCKEMIPTEAAIRAEHERLSAFANAQLGQSEGLDLPEP